jgi:alginate O-acetyltransferase complex protein AlgI
MLFNSFDFAVFLPIVYIFYWSVLKQNCNFQNAFVLFASYVFYGWWDWRFLGLIALSSGVNFTIGIKIGSSQLPSVRKVYLWVSILLNLGILALFKYANFFLDSLI